MRHELIEALSGALFALALIALEKFLPFREPYNILIACGVGAVGFGAFFVMYWQFRHARIIRNLADEMHYFEGDWVEEWHDGATDRYSLATIRFDDKARKYVLIGNSYDEKGDWRARWTSHNMFYDGSLYRLVYISDGEEGGKSVFGATCVYIDDYNISVGRGFFLDQRSDGLERRELTGVHRLSDPRKPWQRDPSAWVQHYHASRSKTSGSIRARPSGKV